MHECVFASFFGIETVTVVIKLEKSPKMKSPTALKAMRVMEWTAKVGISKIIVGECFRFQTGTANECVEYINP